MEGDQSTDGADTDSPVSTSDSQDDTCKFLEKQDTIKERSTNPFEPLDSPEKSAESEISQLSSAMENTGLNYPIGSGARPKERQLPKGNDEETLPKAFGGTAAENADEDEEDVMASSVVCTDGSDVEALTDDRDLSDVELLDTVKDGCANSDEEGRGSWDGGADNTPTKKLFGDNETAVSKVHSGLNNGANGSGNSPSSLPLDSISDGQGAKGFSSGEGDSPFDGDDEITPVAQGYDFMTDLDNMANGGILRPDSLSLPRPLQHRYRQKLARSESESSSWSDIYSHHGSTEALLETSNTPLHTQGTLLKEGDQIAFVAGDLTEKIKRSSPLTKAELDERWLQCRTPSSRSISSINSMSSSASGWSNSSASGWSALSHTSGMSRSSSVLTGSPEEIPPVDPRALADLEAHAYRVGTNLMHMLTTLKTNLHKMSALTGACVETYKESIDNTCDSVDGAIKSMYALMAKCEELSRTMRPVHHLADQIKKIKRILDLFEAQVAEEEKREMLAKSPKK